MNIYKEKSSFTPDGAATGERCGVIEALLLVGSNSFCFVFAFSKDPWSLVSNVILYSAVDECT